MGPALLIARASAPAFGAVEIALGRLRAPQFGGHALVWAGIIAAAVAAVSLGAPLADLPFERDEGGYAYIAWRLGFGELPYLDWFAQKAPGVFWIYQLALALPGDGVAAVRGLAALFAAGSAIALFFAARRLFGPGRAALAALVFACLSADPLLQGAAANTEIFMGLPTLLATLAFLTAVPRERPPAGLLWLVGLGVGVATCFKQVAGVQAFFFLLAYPLLAPVGSRALGLARFAGWAALGGLCAWLPVLALYAARGALPELLDAVLLHNLAYASVMPWSERLANLAGTWRIVSPGQGIAWVLTAAGLVALARCGEGRAALFLCCWGLFAAVGVSASGYFFPHYFHQLLPVVACGAAVAGAALYEAREWHRVPGVLRGAVVLGLLLAQPLVVSASFARLTPDEATRRIYPGNPFDAMPILGDELRAVTTPDANVFVFGADPEVLFYAKRRSATRYVHLFSLYGPYADAETRQREVVADVTAAQPEAIVSIPNGLLLDPAHPQHLNRWLERELDTAYELHAVMAIDPAARSRLYRSAAATPVPDDAVVYAHLYTRRDASESPFRARTAAAPPPLAERDMLPSGR